MFKQDLVATSLVALALAAGCGGSEGEGATSTSGATAGFGPTGGGMAGVGSVAAGGTTGGVALSDVPPLYAAALCALYEGCYGALAELMFNGSDCVTLTEQRIQNGTFPMLEAKIAEGTIRYDGTRIEACIDTVRARACAELLDRDPPECLAALDGTVELGAECDLDEECKGNALCQSSTGTCPGECTSLLVAGQPCRKDGDCQSGLLCSKETALCVQPAIANQACDYRAPPCGPGLVCLGKDDDAQTSGTCKSPDQAFVGAENDTCDVTTGQLCQSGLSCVAETVTLNPLAIGWRCLRRGVYAAGAACKLGVPDACAAGNYCQTAAGVAVLAGGTCTALPATGEPCGTGFGAQCRTGAVCVSGTCQNPVANRVSCTGDAMCLSEQCGVSGGCEPGLPCR